MPSAELSVMEVMKQVFSKVQHTQTCHQKYTKRLTQLYDKSNSDDFTTAFIKCLRVPLTHGESNPNVEHTMDFAAKFAVGVRPLDQNPFLAELFSFVLKSHAVSDPTIRFRICHFLNMLLNSLGENASIDDDLCDNITKTMMDRLLDKSSRVRAQAVFALQRLQDPTDMQCPVTKMYLFHLSRDPAAEVRLAVISSIARTQEALKVMLQRTHDVNDTVRKAAYKFVSKITVHSLTIKQRDALLYNGLNDRSEAVRKTVRDVLLPAWLQYYQSDFINLLRALDPETSTYTGQALDLLLKRMGKDKLLQQLALDEETKVIPVDKLTGENVFYWKRLVQYLQREGNADVLEECLPELSRFCDYIREFQTLMSSKNHSPEKISTLKFCLRQLFELAMTYDLSDEVGRANLAQLIQDTLMSEHTNSKLIEEVVKYCETIIPDVPTRLDALAHVISEIRMPTKQPTQAVEQLTDDEQHERQMQCQRLKMQRLELQNETYEVLQRRDYIQAQKLKEKMDALEERIKELAIVPVFVPDESCEEKNDPETMLKCLGIMCSIAQAKSITNLPPTLRSLFDHMALPSLDHPHDAVRVLALKAVAICLLLDQELAKKHLMIYFLQFTDQENFDGWKIAIQAIFDLFLRYGLECFKIVHDENKRENSRRSGGTVRLFNNTDDDMTDVSTATENGSPNIVNILIQLLDNGEQDIRTMATAGFCKLLLHRKLSSIHLVSRLIILLFNPVTEDDSHLRQYLISFFKRYVVAVPESHDILERAFIPTLRTIFNAPDISPLHSIEPHYIASFIINLTNSQHHTPGKEDFTVHNNLAFTILAEALIPDSEIDRDTLLKSLKHLNIRCDTEQLKVDMRTAVDKITENLPESDRILRKCVAQFMMKIDGRQAEENNVQEDIQRDQDEPDD